MTQHRQLKALVRQRMARTGEAYTTARRHVLNARPAHEYVLRGGTHPETAALANAFANRGITVPGTDTPIDEALVLGVGGGLGMGYILWEFDGGDTRVVTTGFRNQWQYPQRWFAKVCQRLGIDVSIHQTAGPKRAADQLDAALDAGLPAVAAISAGDIGYWHLPADSSGWIGYPVVVYGRVGDGALLVDDRNTGPLTVPVDVLAAARARIGSYKHRLVVADPAATEVDGPTLRTAVLAGLVDQVEHLSSRSDSFSLPAIAKWSRLVDDDRRPKGWGTVFADGRGLLGALVSVVEAIDEVGILGGNLRGLYADFLDGAGPLVDLDLSDAAGAYRAAGDGWAGVAAVCGEVEVVGAVVEADRRRRAAVARGDAGSGAARRAADQGRALLATDETGLGAAGRRRLFTRLSEALAEVHHLERQALEALVGAVGGPER